MRVKFLLTTLFTVTMFNLASAQCTTGNCYDGNGSYMFENGDLYNGQWKKGEMFGYGVYEFVNGDVYKGAWKNGLMEGRGTYTYANGDKYIGAWKDGKMNGRGHFHWSLPGDLMTNAKYEGFFKDGLPKNIEVKEAGVPLAQPER
jgi:hypothetical protein